MIGRRLERSGTAVALFGVFALVLALSFEGAMGGSVEGLQSFSNGQVADAVEVNANFQAVKTAVDDNDGRIANNATAVADLATRLDALEAILALRSIDGEDLRVVRGTIGLQGGGLGGSGPPTVRSGSGWSVSSIETGRWQVTFDTPFPNASVDDHPTIALAKVAAGTAVVQSPDHAGFVVVQQNPSGTQTDEPIMFVAVGPRE